MDNGKINTKFKKLNCAPSADVSYDKNKNFTCYKSEELIQLKEAWNKRHPDVKINTNNVKEIWEELKNNMQDTCNNEACWLNQQFINSNINKELLHYTFAPKAPASWNKNPNEWLSSVDITRVMKQYERVYPSFNFIGPSPIDFDTIISGGGKTNKKGVCVWDEICNFSLQKHLEKGIKKIGFIFNTDPHYKSGSHWISLFINIEKNDNFIFYFDSNGISPPKQIKKLCERILKEANETLGMNDLMYYENKRSHQKSDTECGMYALYMIIELLLNSVSKGNAKTHDINYFMNTWIPDAKVEGLRNKYFNKSV